MVAEPVRALERLVVDRVVAGGDALARDASGRVVFVPGALPGETVTVRIGATKRDFARATLVDVDEASALRVEPPCPVWHRGCGGCDWQHVDPGEQLALKAEVVRDALRRTAKLEDADVRPEASVPPWAYRTTMRFALDRDGRASLRRHRSHELVALDRCLIAHPLLAELLPDVRLPGADELVLRVSAATGERTAAWTPRADRVLGLPAGVRTGRRARLVEHVAGVPLRVSAGSFFQSGPHAAELLVETVRAACGEALAGAGSVADLYGGVGLMSATLTGAGQRIVLVESSADACDDARVNLAERDASVVRATVETWRPERVDLVIADPARQGLGRDAAARIGETGASTLVLVSCDPVALARDVTLLAAAGFRAGTARVIDLFPQTHHVEVVTTFTR